MSYLKFDKTVMINLEESLTREVLRTNRLGAYHCTTVVDCNTRKYHGLLVMPVPAIDDDNHVLLSSFDETVIQHGAEFNLGLHKYAGDNFSPKGHKYIREYSSETVPRTLYRVGGVIFSKEKVFSMYENRIMIKYTLEDAHSATTLRFRPFLAFRNVKNLTQANGNVNQSYEEVTNGIKTCMYPGYPELYMQFNKKVKFVYEPYWYNGIEYPKEQERGYPYQEDLYVPGYFEVPIKKGETIIFSAGDSAVATTRLKALYENEVVARTPRTSFFNCLKNSAQQFYFRPKEDDAYLLAGYPWFKVRARDLFVALPVVPFGKLRFQHIGQIFSFSVQKTEKFSRRQSLHHGSLLCGNGRKRGDGCGVHTSYSYHPQIPEVLLQFPEYGNLPGCHPRSGSWCSSWRAAIYPLRRVCRSLMYILLRQIHQYSHTERRMHKYSTEFP